MFKSNDCQIWIRIVLCMSRVIIFSKVVLSTTRVQMAYTELQTLVSKVATQK